MKKLAKEKEKVRQGVEEEDDIDDKGMANFIDLT